MENNNVSKSWVNAELDRPSLLATRDKMKSVFDLIGALPRKVAAVASNAEKEFLSAYRVHMLSIHSELKELNDQVKQAEEQLKSDTQVESLEKEVSWFKEEKLRLQKNSDCMHQDLDAMANKLKELNDQRKFLSDQLKTVMKRSRVLESELQAFGYGGEGNNSIGNDNRSVGTNSVLSNNITHSKGKSKQLLTSQSLPALEPYSAARASAELNRTGSSNRLGSRSHKMKLKKSGSKNEIFEPLLNPNAKSVDETQSKHPHVALAAIKQRRTSSELNLEEALRAVFRRIVSRKIQYAAQNSLSRTDNKLNDNIEQRSLLETSLIESATSVGGVTGLGLEHFTDIDRMDAMIKYLSNPQEFEKIIEAICDLPN